MISWVYLADTSRASEFTVITRLSLVPPPRTLLCRSAKGAGRTRHRRAQHAERFSCSGRARTLREVSTVRGGTARSASEGRQKKRRAGAQKRPPADRRPHEGSAAELRYLAAFMRRGCGSCRASRQHRIRSREWPGTRGRAWSTHPEFACWGLAGHRGEPLQGPGFAPGRQKHTKQELVGAVPRAR